MRWPISNVFTRTFEGAVGFRELSWNTIDRAAQTFDEWDAKGCTWDQLDLIGEALFEI